MKQIQKKNIKASSNLVEAPGSSPRVQRREGIIASVLNKNKTWPERSLSQKKVEVRSALFTL
jgi:hypothetical protein